MDGILELVVFFLVVVAVIVLVAVAFYLRKHGSVAVTQFVEEHPDIMEAVEFGMDFAEQLGLKDALYERFNSKKDAAIEKANEYAKTRWGIEFPAELIADAIEVVFFNLDAVKYNVPDPEERNLVNTNVVNG